MTPPPTLEEQIAQRTAAISRLRRELADLRRQRMIARDGVPVRLRAIAALFGANLALLLAAAIA